MRAFPVAINCIGSTRAPRLAEESDLVAINDIYNHYVLHSTCTYQEAPEPMAGCGQWFASHGFRHPTIATHIEDVPPDEMKRRAAELFGMS